MSHMNKAVGKPPKFQQSQNFVGVLRDGVNQSFNTFLNTFCFEAKIRLWVREIRSVVNAIIRLESGHTFASNLQRIAIIFWN